MAFRAYYAVDDKIVLMPKLYFVLGYEALTDTTISGRNVSLMAGSITNSGTITAPPLNVGTGIASGLKGGAYA